MTGYIRPLRGELRVREYEGFGAMYCGLCHALGQRYGPFGRLFLSYDLCFMALVLGAVRDGALLDRPSCSFQRKRCVASPFRRKCVAPRSEMIDFAADASVVLTYWKLRDGVSDEKGLKKMVFGLLAVLTRPLYRRAAQRVPDFARAAQEGLAALRDMETACVASIDRPADAFAGILRAAAQGETEAEQRAQAELFYHAGRWAYIVDAWDDLEEDLAAGRYNPIVQRYGIRRMEDAAQVREAVEHTIACSAQAASLAAGFLELGGDTEMIHNVLHLGMPAMVRRVFDGGADQTLRSKINERPL